MNSQNLPADPLASQRVDGDARLTVGHVEGRTRLRQLHQRGAAKIRLPRVAEGALEAILINTAGGLTGGDRIVWQVEAGAGSQAVVTTQASEKVYRSASGLSNVTVRLAADKTARLAWLPQETILFERSALSRRLDAEIAPGARLLLCEATVFGRTAMGEAVTRGFFRDRWRVRVAGRLVHAEDFCIGPAVAPALATRPGLGGAAAMATVLLISDDGELILDEVRDIIGDTGGASHWRVGETGKLLARLHAIDGYTLRKRLMPLLAVLNGRASLPKAWSL